jgi:hypothetical protein
MTYSLRLLPVGSLALLVVREREELSTAGAKKTRKTRQQPAAKS